jgi:hypothetical protein
VVPNITSALQNALAHREVESRANLDGLMGVSSRCQLLRFLDEELSRARRTEQPVALSIVELPGYRNLAESFGYPTMDDLLIAISKSLMQPNHSEEWIPRLSGGWLLPPRIGNDKRPRFRHRSNPCDSGDARRPSSPPFEIISRRQAIGVAGRKIPKGRH